MKYINCGDVRYSSINIYTIAIGGYKLFLQFVVTVSGFDCYMSGYKISVGR
jgi:hypothetical protein